MTLLEMTQNILSDLNSDEINSISDTVESDQVASVIQSCYFDLLADTSIPEHFELGQLTALGDITLPNYMQLPTNTKNVKWVKYDNHTVAEPQIVYTPIRFMNPDSFFEMVDGNNSTDSNITTVTDPSGVKLLIRNDKFPQWFTTFDDNYLVFDSFSLADESSLTSSRSSIWCSFEPIFIMEDSFTPPLDSELFPRLLAEAKSLCFVNNTQSVNAKVEQIAKRHRNFSQGKMHRISVNNLKDWPNFGRKRFER